MSQHEMTELTRTKIARMSSAILTAIEDTGDSAEPWIIMGSLATVVGLVAAESTRPQQVLNSMVDFAQCFVDGGTQ